MNLSLLDDPGWVPSACTLPTEEQPLRVAEFDDFFSHDAIAVTRPALNRLSIAVRAEPEAASRAAALAAKETGCCSFFTFDLALAGGEITLSVTTEAGHTDVLTALGDRAERLVREAGR